MATGSPYHALADILRQRCHDRHRWYRTLLEDDRRRAGVSRRPVRGEYRPEAGGSTPPTRPA